MTPLDTSADAALVARIRDASTRVAAFDELFIALREQVFAVCLHVTGNAADADDALQETFLAVHDGLPRFRGESRLSTWVHRIAIRASIRVRAATSRRTSRGRSADARARPVARELGDGLRRDGRLSRRRTASSSRSSRSTI